MPSGIYFTHQHYQNSLKFSKSHKHGSDRHATNVCCTCKKKSYIWVGIFFLLPTLNKHKITKTELPSRKSCAIFDILQWITDKWKQHLSVSHINLEEEECGNEHKRKTDFSKKTALFNNSTFPKLTPNLFQVFLYRTVRETIHCHCLNHISNMTNATYKF